jgi:hypothetical protein
MTVMMTITTLVKKVRIRGKRLDVQMIHITLDQAIYRFFDAPPKFCGETLNELICFATDLKSAFCMNIHQFLMASRRFSVSPRFISSYASSRSISSSGDRISRSSRNALIFSVMDSHSSRGTMTAEAHQHPLRTRRHQRAGRADQELSPPGGGRRHLLDLRGSGFKILENLFYPHPRAIQ